MPEFILIVVFIISLIIIKVVHKKYNFALSGRIAMAAMLLTTGVAHFVFTKGMSLMLPDIIPYKYSIVYITGVLELMAAIGILIPKFQKISGWMLIIFMIAIIPSNIYAALAHVNLENASLDGNGPIYLWYRIPLQVFFITWIYLSCVKPIKP